MSTKLCPKCKTEKSVSEFYKAKERKDGLRNRCKSCCSIEHNESYHRNKGKGWTRKLYIHNRASNLRSRYDITVDEYNKMFKDQKGVCLICGEAQTDKLLAVDHDHETNKIRGLLCSLCNKGLGCFKDNINNLEQAIKYLRRDR